MTLFDRAPMSTAVISECGTYRYRLTREWDGSKPSACLVMLNPSTADATTDDPTIRKCVAFARSWDCGGIVVVNLFAFRATDPKALRAGACPKIGPENDRHIREAVEQCSPVVCAWGVHGAWGGRDVGVKGCLRSWGVPAKCLGVTKDGHPKHPLYLPGNTALVAFGDTQSVEAI